MVVFQVIEYVISGGRPEITGDVQMLKPYKMLMMKCWDTSPDDRHSFKQVGTNLYWNVLIYIRVFDCAGRYLFNL